MDHTTFSVTNAAARAYRTGSATPSSSESTVFGQTSPLKTGVENVGGDAQNSFTDMVAAATQSAVETVRTGDAMGQAGLMGKADPQAVVEATLSMESTLKTVVSVRDKLVTAYQEVLRMPI